MQMHIINKKMKRNTFIDHTLIIDELETSIKLHNLNSILSFLPKGSYLVGGYIRDIILKRVTEEIDVDIVVPRDALKIGKKISDNIESKFITLDENLSIKKHYCLKTNCYDVKQNLDKSGNYFL